MVRTKPSARSPWFYLLGTPIIWGVHFLAIYLWVETACRARLTALDAAIFGLTITSHVVLALTLVAVIAAFYIGYSAFRHWREIPRGLERLEASRWQVEGERFMAICGVMLSILFAITILLTGLPALILRPCSF